MLSCLKLFLMSLWIKYCWPVFPWSSDTFVGALSNGNSYAVFEDYDAVYAYLAFKLPAASLEHSEVLARPDWY